jgi:hypothetical protein
MYTNAIMAFPATVLLMDLIAVKYMEEESFVHKIFQSCAIVEYVLTERTTVANRRNFIADDYTMLHVDPAKSLNNVINLHRFTTLLFSH